MRLVFAFVTFVVSGVGSGAGWNADSNVGSRVAVLSKFLVVNNLLLKLLRTFTLAPNYNPKSFKKDFFRLFLYLYQSSLIQ